ncbi:MAG: cytochrome c biogenesis heme-transporting ATPase CcmA [Chromatiales bacterium]
MLEGHDLECARGERLLFRALTLRVEAGTLLRVAGPNGSGKTSLLRLLCGLLQPTHGLVRWRGSNIRVLREDYWREIAHIGHLNGIKDDLTALENLRTSATIAGLTSDEGAARAALADLGLAGCEHTLARRLSLGQRRRIALARLFLSGSIPLWILDEPFTALDARGLAALCARIGEHLAASNIVLLTTHLDVPIKAPATRLLTLGGNGNYATC